MGVWSIGSNKVAPTTVNGLPSGVDNDLGTIRAGGNISDTDKFAADAVSLGTARYVTIVSGTNGVESSVAAGAFNGGDQVIRRITSDIAGVSNTTLLSGGSNSANRPFSIKQKAIIRTKFYKTAVRTGGWQEFSGVFSPAVTVTESGGWDIVRDSDESANLKTYTTDDAANPTAAVPGEMVYRDGSPTPNQDEYQAKKLF